MTNDDFRQRDEAVMEDGLIVDGYERAIDAITAEVRQEIEQRFAEEWNTSGMLKRWMLTRKIEKEVQDLVTERSKHISPEALY